MPGKKKGPAAAPAPAPAAATLSKTEREFWDGDGVKFTVMKAKAQGVAVLDARVSVQSFRGLGAAPAQPVIVEATDGDMRVLQLVPSNALVGSQVQIPESVPFTGTVMLKAAPAGEGAAPVASATAVPVVADDADAEASGGVTGTLIPDHVLVSLLKAELCGRAVAPIGAKALADIACTLTVMRRTLEFKVRPHVAEDARDAIMWFDNTTDVRIAQRRVEAATGAAEERTGLKEVGCLPEDVRGRIAAVAASGGVCGVVIHGPRGVGKSYVARRIGAALGWDTTVVSDAFLADASLKTIAGVFENRAPAVVVLDETTALSQDKTDAASAAVYLEETLCKQFERTTARTAPLVVVACVAAVDALPKRLTTHGRLDQEVRVEPPSNATEREALLGSVLRQHGWGDAEVRENGEELRRIAGATHGYVAVDFQILYSTAELAAAAAEDARVEAAAAAQPVTVRAEHLLAAAKVVRPSSLKSLEVSIPSVRWADIGGQAEAKQVLRECVEWPLKYADVFAQLALKPPSGVLLYGPPGCSKTLLAKALATECSYNFIAIKGPELYNKWVGESEKAVRDVFAKARSAAPAVIFFDEIDGMCGKRGGGGVTDRVISQFLTEMDGLPNKKADGRQVVVLAATNRPDNIDPALLRPGRIDRKVYIQLPDAATRTEICRITLAKIPTAPNVDFEKLGAELDGRSGAEVVSAMKEGVQHCLQRNEGAAAVDQRDLMRGVRRVLPRTNKEHLKFYENWGKH